MDEFWLSVLVYGLAGFFITIATGLPYVPTWIQKAREEVEAWPYYDEPLVPRFDWWYLWPGCWTFSIAYHVTFRRAKRRQREARGG